MQSQQESLSRVCVVVSSSGRPECLAFLWRRLCAQTRKPHRVIFSVPRKEDLPASFCADDQVVPEVILSPKGLTRQRNKGMEMVLDDADVIVFFDDDYVPSVTAIEGIRRAFETLPDVTGLTGKLLADGAGGPGLEPAEAAQLVDEWDAGPGRAVIAAPPREIAPRPWLYGCNMAYRASAIGETRFDERLPLYAWQEDIDFSGRIPGRMMLSDALVGVHCGVKRGREKRGELLGYSQIANPVYLLRKGSMTPRFALRLCVRNFLSNHARAFWPEPWVDRRGRVRGNWRAIFDLCRGKIDPERLPSLQ
ncbi:MAG: family 2 glycosyl transferase [Rhodobacteraceae bacterium]|nr:family 2 glycosyl transferase [Paracoccaceae bacterium]MAY45205.1 family 2 glycosyl transferase [Paracoccaceae bacterium]